MVVYVSKWCILSLLCDTFPCILRQALTASGCSLYPTVTLQVCSCIIFRMPWYGMPSLSNMRLTFDRWMSSLFILSKVVPVAETVSHVLMCSTLVICVTFGQ